jgi:hypothetical protein
MKAGIDVQEPDKLRPLLHGKIDRLDSRGLAMVHRILLQLEAERLTEELRDEFAGEHNLVERVDKAIARVREERPYK